MVMRGTYRECVEEIARRCDDTKKNREEGRSKTKRKIYTQTIPPL
jgi:hypothetical protein